MSEFTEKISCDEAYICHQLEYSTKFLDFLRHLGTSLLLWVSCNKIPLVIILCLQKNLNCFGLCAVDLPLLFAIRDCNGEADKVMAENREERKLTAVERDIANTFSMLDCRRDDTPGSDYDLRDALMNDKEHLVNADMHEDGIYHARVICISFYF